MGARAQGLASVHGDGSTQHLGAISIPRRIPLRKGRSMREVMREKGVLERVRMDLRGDPGRKYQLSNAVAYEPLANYLDVSIEAFPSSSEPSGSGVRECPPPFPAPAGSSSSAASPAKGWY